MIEICDRPMYFAKDEELRWIELPHWLTYNDIKFHTWVYRIDLTEYPFCTPEFKEAFLKAKTWETLQFNRNQ